MPYVTSVERVAFRRAYDQAFDEARLVGLEEARREGQAELLTRILTRRFGPLPPEVTARLSAASDADLGDWGDRVIEATSLAEVFNGA